MFRSRTPSSQVAGAVALAIQKCPGASLLHFDVSREIPPSSVALATAELLGPFGFSVPLPTDASPKQETIALDRAQSRPRLDEGPWVVML